MVPLLASCGDAGDDARVITIPLEGRVGDRAFACGETYEGIGTPGTAFVARHFRFYVHDVRVTTDDGAEHAVSLVDDGEWQNDGVALLDFEAGEGCEGGNVPINTQLVGTIPASAGEVTGVRFRIGVPESRNHLDSATAPSPLNLTSMYWGWQDGYKYLRVEGSTTGQPTWLLHVGATGCSGDARMGTRTCAQRNEGSVALDEFDPARDVIVADLATLLATLDLDTDAGGAPGCMSGPTDPECAQIFEALGVNGAASQRFFRIEERAE